jgi:hypothetical protein
MKKPVTKKNEHKQERQWWRFPLLLLNFIYLPNHVSHHGTHAINGKWYKGILSMFAWMSFRLAMTGIIMAGSGVGGKKERTVVGQTNRSSSNSPRRGVPAGGVNSVSLLDSVVASQLTMSTTWSPRSSVNGASSSGSFRDVAVGDCDHRLSGRSALPIAASELTSNGSISSVVASPRANAADSSNSVSLKRENSVANIAESARVNGMRALLFDKFDSAASAPPPIPAAPLANTRFSSRTTTDTTLMVEPQRGTATHAAPQERFSFRGAVHLGPLIATEDKQKAAKLASARADHARELHAGQCQSIIEHDKRTVQQDKERIHAKTLLQQQYESTRRAK